MADRSTEARKKSAIGRALVLAIAGIVMAVIENLLFLGLLSLGVALLIILTQYLPLVLRQRNLDRER